jgi:hypothetical protein
MPGVDLFLHFNDNYLMSLMFFLSGLFVWPSLARKGGAIFCATASAAPVLKRVRAVS